MRHNKAVSSTLQIFEHQYRRIHLVPTGDPHPQSAVRSSGIKSSGMRHTERNGRAMLTLLHHNELANGKFCQSPRPLRSMGISWCNERPQMRRCKIRSNFSHASKPSRTLDRRESWTQTPAACRAWSKAERAKPLPRPARMRSSLFPASSGGEAPAEPYHRP